MRQLSLDLRPKIGSRVKLLKDIYDPPDEDGPGGYLALLGEELIVRGFSFKSDAILVSHEHITDRSFRVDEGEYYITQNKDNNNEKTCGRHTESFVPSPFSQSSPKI